MEWSDGKITFKGESDELLGLIRESKVDAATLLPTKPFYVSNAVFAIAAVIFLLLACLCWCFDSYLINYRGVEFIILLAVGGGVCACCHGCFRNTFVNIVCGVVSVLILCVSMHLNTPEEATEYIKGKVDNTVDKEIEKINDKSHTNDD